MLARKSTQSLYSYMSTLQAVLHYLEGKGKFSAVEWGSGLSTYEISHSPKCQRLLSIENDPFWYKISVQCYGGQRGNLDLRYIELPTTYDPFCSYVCVPERNAPYDLMFVDGAMYRAECLLSAKSLLREGGIAMMHDYSREFREVDGPPDAPGRREYAFLHPLIIHQFRYYRELLKSRVVLVSNDIDLKIFRDYTDES